MDGGGVRKTSIRTRAGPVRGNLKHRVHHSGKGGSRRKWRNGGWGASVMKMKAKGSDETAGSVGKIEEGKRTNISFHDETEQEGKQYTKAAKQAA